MSQMTTKKITRRDFIRKAGKGGIIIAGIGALPRAARSWGASDADFTAHQRETMECIADTAVPPTFEEGERKPGAVEARAWKLMKDPFYEVSRFIPYITWDIDIFCYFRYGLRFIDLDYEKREQVLLDREVRGGLGGILAPAYRMTINVAKIAFFGGVINRVGTDYVGFTY
jgi:hypothetical protein